MYPLLEVRNLTKRFGDFLAVDDLSFSVNEGDVYGFLGQNGAGKSTTLRMLLTLVRPTQGEIQIFGKSLYQNRKQILSKTGALIERSDLYNYLNALDNLSVFARMSGVRPESKRLYDMLSFIGLKGREKDKVKTYSMGMKQRLGIAIALIHDPQLIILDEPTNGLDPQGIADIRNLIIKLSREQGKTVIVSSHLLSEVELIANRMIIIDKGRKIVEGEVSTLLDPSHTIVKIETTDPDKAKSVLEKHGITISSIRNAIIETEINRDEIPSLVQLLTDAHIPILAVNPVHSLEHYFLSLTQPTDYV